MWARNCLFIVVCLTGASLVANTLLRRGFTKSSLPVGTEIVVHGYRAKNGANRANGRDIMLPDGKRLFLGSSGTGAPEDGKDPEK